jgi:hypothetical protein
MSRKLKRLTGAGAGGDFNATEKFTFTAHIQPLKEDVDILMLSTLFRNLWVGGTVGDAGINVEADGDYDIPNWKKHWVDNTSQQLTNFTDTNGATFVFQYHYYLRVSSGVISLTPKMRYGTTYSDVAVAGTGSVATISGALACSGTAADFTGTNQYQIVGVTHPTGKKIWKPQVTVASTGGVPFEIWLDVYADCYIQS